MTNNAGIQNKNPKSYFNKFERADWANFFWILDTLYNFYSMLLSQDIMTMQNFHCFPKSLRQIHEYTYVFIANGEYTVVYHLFS